MQVYSRSAFVGWGLISCTCLAEVQYVCTCITLPRLGPKIILFFPTASRAPVLSRRDHVFFGTLLKFPSYHRVKDSATLQGQADKTWKTTIRECTSTIIQSSASSFIRNQYQPSLYTVTNRMVMVKFPLTTSRTYRSYLALSLISSTLFEHTM